ncbi:MAG: hypothetical protein HND40_04135 [Ignavibacteriota bacterium]|jgi:hypothetical protein|nr:MAG: hypothetical protein F9K42_00630 [Ignavibacterium sp.]MBL1155986.1 hypothetical protein [Ignavibacteriota bacterium]MCO6447326.1 hypothetical protein [Ignavibacterium album]MCZ2269342.1 hypothetical protein [Ignavibacteriales bacterium]MDX9712754.1 hypothetical protein [Ignavibacteriaceae bacterium]
MKVLSIYLLIFLLLLLLAGYYFLYNIYGVEIKKSANNLYADFDSEITIKIYPINALGKKAWFRKTSASFEIVEGSDLISVLENNSDEGIIRIRANGKTGLVGIKIKSVHSLFPEYIEFEILPLTA